MTKIYNTKSVFTGTHEFSIGDSILEEGVVLDIQNMEYPKDKLRLELSDDELLDIHRLITQVLDDRQNIKKDISVFSKFPPSRIIYSK